MVDLFCMQINSRIEAPCVNGDADRIRSANYGTVLNSRNGRASLLTLRRFGAQINWRVISRKVLFAPYRIAFLSNWSPVHIAGQSGIENTFLTNGMFKKKMDIDRLTTVNILTHLISRYQPPLNFIWFKTFFSSVALLICELLRITTRTTTFFRFFIRVI